MSKKKNRYVEKVAESVQQDAETTVNETEVNEEFVEESTEVNETEESVEQEEASSVAEEPENEESNDTVEEVREVSEDEFLADSMEPEESIESSSEEDEESEEVASEVESEPEEVSEDDFLNTSEIESNETINAVASVDAEEGEVNEKPELIKEAPKEIPTEVPKMETPVEVEEPSELQISYEEGSALERTTYYVVINNRKDDEEYMKTLIKRANKTGKKFYVDNNQIIFPQVSDDKQEARNFNKTVMTVGLRGAICVASSLSVPNPNRQY